MDNRRDNKFLKDSHVVTRLAKERASLLKINDINNISFFWNAPHLDYAIKNFVKRNSILYKAEKKILI
jgi:hypothetical protein